MTILAIKEQCDLGVQYTSTLWLQCTKIKGHKGACQPGAPPFDKAKTPPFEHQKIGTAALVKNPAFALFDEMGCGKSKQVIDAACQLAAKGKIDTVVIVAPASVRCVWLDAEIGEIKKHSTMPNRVLEFHAKTKHSWHDLDETHNGRFLTWVVTNYEFLRSAKRLDDLIDQLGGTKTLLVLDESSYIKSRQAQQTKAVKKLRQACARCVLLNGTPIANSPLDLWAQMQVLSPEILERRYKNFYFFRSEFCELRQQRFGARSFKVVASYRRLDKLAAVCAPYVLRREKKDCLDLPPKLYTEREVVLAPESWKRYVELRRDALVTIGEGNVQLEPNAAVRIIRLAQLTSGILGGDIVSGADLMPGAEDPSCRDLSDEKLRWAVEYLTEECQAKAVIVWCRWRRERERLHEELWKSKNRNLFLFQIYGGQVKGEREESVRWFNSDQVDGINKSHKGISVLLAQPHAGGHGLNLVAASEAIYLSNDFALGIRLQSEDRCHRPGQRNAVTYLDVLATGPEGQKTIDHVIAKALREKKHLAMMTCDEWRKELESE